MKAVAALALSSAVILAGSGVYAGTNDTFQQLNCHWDTVQAPDGTIYETNYHCDPVSGNQGQTASITTPTPSPTIVSNVTTESVSNTDSHRTYDGHDEVVTKGTVSKKGTVKGATTTALSNVKKAVAAIFQQVYHRVPTTTELKYWTSRIKVGDKTTSQALKGAMEWHQLHGLNH